MLYYSDGLHKSRDAVLRDAMEGKWDCGGSINTCLCVAPSALVSILQSSFEAEARLIELVNAYTHAHIPKTSPHICRYTNQPDLHRDPQPPSPQN